MGYAKQTVKVTRGKTKIKTPVKGSSKTKARKGGNPNRCPSCGRFM